MVSMGCGDNGGPSEGPDKLSHSSHLRGHRRVFRTCLGEILEELAKPILTPCTEKAQDPPAMQHL